MPSQEMCHNIETALADVLTKLNGLSWQLADAGEKRKLEEARVCVMHASRMMREIGESRARELAKVVAKHNQPGVT